jgi:hypothetical protein
MSCAITAGYAIDCRDSIGGVEAVYITEFGNISNIVDASGLVTGLTKATGKRFYKFEVPQSTASASDNGKGSVENGSIFFDHEVKLPLNKRDATTRNLILTLFKNKCIIVTKEKTGKYMIYGKDNGMWLNASTGGSGVASGDRAGYEVTFTAEEKEPAMEVNSTVGLALETAG